MKKALTRTKVIYYYKNSVRINGAPPGVSGNLSNVRGDLTGVSGNLSNVRGDLTGVSGNLSGVSGNLDDCDITDKDRNRGIDIEELIK